jgi:hypothetical protein
MTEPVVFKFSVSVLAIPFGVAAVALIVAVVCLVTGKKWPAVVALIIALIAGGVFGPAMFCDRVIVSTDDIEQRTGFPWSQTVKGFRFGDVSYVHITEKPTGSKRRLTTIWEIHEKNGTTRDIDPGDLWESNSGEIIPLLESRGVEFR